MKNVDIEDDSEGKFNIFGSGSIGHGEGKMFI
jgi:hypothetical protein